MRSRNRAVGWTVALATAAALVTAGTVYAASDTTPARTSLSSEEMRSVLVSLADQPESRFTRGPITLKQAASENAFAAPDTMVFKPKSCATYLEDVVGSLNSLDGWIQYGSRIHEDHNDNFIQVVVTIPGGADQKLLDRIRESMTTCTSGTLTLESKVTGDVSYTERSAPSLPDAATFAATGRTVFHEEPGTEGSKIVSTYEMPPDSQLLLTAEQDCVAEFSFVASGDTLLMVMESDLAFADEVATTMYQRSQKILAN